MKDLVIEKFQENFKKKMKVYTGNPHQINADIEALINKQKNLSEDDKQELWELLTKVVCEPCELSFLDGLSHDFDVIMEDAGDKEKTLKRLKERYNLNDIQVELLKNIKY